MDDMMRIEVTEKRAAMLRLITTYAKLKETRGPNGYEEDKTMGGLDFGDLND